MSRRFCSTRLSLHHTIRNFVGNDRLFPFLLSHSHSGEYRKTQKNARICQQKFFLDDMMNVDVHFDTFILQMAISISNIDSRHFHIEILHLRCTYCPNTLHSMRLNYYSLPPTKYLYFSTPKHSTFTPLTQTINFPAVRFLHSFNAFSLSTRRFATSLALISSSRAAPSIPITFLAHSTAIKYLSIS